MEEIKADKRGLANLEAANQMYKDAFTVKKMRFKHLHPHLSEEDLTKMTADYFKHLNLKVTT